MSCAAAWHAASPAETPPGTGDLGPDDPHASQTALPRGIEEAVRPEQGRRHESHRYPRLAVELYQHSTDWPALSPGVRTTRALP